MFKLERACGLCDLLCGNYLIGSGFGVITDLVCVGVISAFGVISFGALQGHSKGLETVLNSWLELFSQIHLISIN